jgi:hypothetical protein
MKKIALALIVLSFSLPLQTMAEVSPTKKTAKEKRAEEKVEAGILLKRLEEIKKIDVSTLSPEEKAELRKEVPAIGKRLKEIGGGIYISVGALLLIIILLIIFL